VAAPPHGINLGGFEIREYENLDPVEVDGLIEKRVKFTIAAYDTGTYAIPPTGIVVISPDSTQEILLTDEINIRVESVISGDAEDILDLKTPLDIPKSWTLIIIAAVSIFAALAVGGWIYYRRKNKKGEGLFDFRKEPDRPAHEIALENLEQLRESGLLAEGKIKEYYIELSEIIRLYLQRRYFFAALEMTTFEAVNALAETMIEEEALSVTADFLENCDMVKFAKFRPKDEVHEQSWKQALEIVERTKVELTPVTEIESSTEQPEDEQKKLEEPKAEMSVVPDETTDGEE
jgi:hypothetical protein